MSHSITVTESLYIEATPEAVWDYTQDWTRRTEWDPGVRKAEIVQSAPEPLVRVQAPQGVAFTARYKLYRRPERTSLVMEDTKPPWLGGGGSWSYEPEGDGTRWTQTNTLTIASGWRRWLFGWLVRSSLRKNTRRSMQRAREALEG